MIQQCGLANIIILLLYIDKIHLQEEKNYVAKFGKNNVNGEIFCS
jgi:hypothetical protein